MSQENVEIARKGSQAFDRGDIDGFLALCDPAVVWDHSHYASGEFDPVYYGHDGVERFLKEWREFFEGYYVHREEFIDAGEAVLMRGRQGGRGKSSGATVESPPYWVIYRVRNGLVVQIEFYREKNEALKAVGLAE